MPVGRPRLSADERQLREQQRRDRIWKCTGCDRELSRSQWYAHRTRDCGTTPTPPQDTAENPLKRTHNDAFCTPTNVTSDSPSTTGASTSDQAILAQLDVDTDGMDLLDAHLVESEPHRQAEDETDAMNHPAMQETVIPRSAYNADPKEVLDLAQPDDTDPASHTSSFPSQSPPDPGSLEDIATQDAIPRPLSPNSFPSGIPIPVALPPEPTVIHLEDLKYTQEFIEALRGASLAEDKLHPDVLDRLREPLTHELRIDDAGERCSVEFYLQDTSEANYNASCDTIRRVYNTDTLTYAQVKTKVRDISGVHPIYNDMCIKGCLAFVGPFKTFSRCPKCSEHRYDQYTLETTGKRVARQQFVTIPVGPQIQAAYRSPDSAENMQYRANRTREIFESLGVGEGISTWADYVDGSAYLEAVNALDIDETTTVLMGSLDGAQLFRMKASDCWIYIWVLLDRSPDSRYKKKHVLIGGVIPGPDKPGNIDSFLFPGLYHVSALMHDGFKIWDAKRDITFTSRPFLAFMTADGPGMTEVNGLVGHSGAQGCRLYCAMKGRHKPNVGHYYPACLKPHSYSVEGCMHADVSLSSVTSPESQRTATDRYEENLRKVLSSTSQTAYRHNRRATGISKPSLLSGLHSDRIFSIPGCFPADLMHLASLNLPDLLLSLWMGTMSCDTSLGDDKVTWDWAVFRDGAVWNKHGKEVAAATSYLPGSFDRPPRNPAEKLSSGYKAMEFLTYIYGLGPGLLYGILPMPYWKNFCKLVRGVRIVHQKVIEKKELTEADQLLLEFCIEFEELYYQRKPSRLHFVRQSIHALAHIAAETTRIGPYAGVAQWTMENAIGNLGREIRQPSNAFANLTQRAVRRCQINALKAMLPELDPPKPLPRGSEELPGGYVLLRKHDRISRPVTPTEATALQRFVDQAGIQVPDDWQADPTVSRWARVRLPNGQVARSLWKEQGIPLSRLRMSRNVKITRDGTTSFGEVRYYFKLRDSTSDSERTYAMVNFYSLPDADLLRESSNTLWSCSPQADEHGLQVIEVNTIQTVVAMVPHPSIDDETLGDLSNRVFVVEKIGLDAILMGGAAEEDLDGE